MITGRLDKVKNAYVLTEAQTGIVYRFVGLGKDGEAQLAPYIGKTVSVKLVVKSVESAKATKRPARRSRDRSVARAERSAPAQAVVGDGGDSSEPAPQLPPFASRKSVWRSLRLRSLARFMIRSA